MEEPEYLLDYSIDLLNDIKWNKQMLDIALEHSKTFNEKNFDRICVLLENFYGILDCNLEGIEASLDKLRSYQKEKINDSK